MHTPVILAAAEGIINKRQITVTVVVAMTGEMLPMQVFYTEKTERCHPAYTFPADFDIWHTQIIGQTRRQQSD